MTDSIATLSQENDISIIKLDDGKANAFSYDMLSQVNELLAKVPRDSGALVITGRDGLFSGGFDLKTLATGDMEKITKIMGIEGKDQKLYFSGAPLDEPGEKLGELEMSDGDTVFDEPPTIDPTAKKKPKAEKSPPPLGDELLDQKGMTESEAAESKRHRKKLLLVL